ncbi:MAG: hypothetical protein IJ586_08315, partial [Alloprevotella sp.]|nr:hypothetical protein [Alloprevotella sp.]
IKVINKASGTGMYLDATDPATMTSNAKVWTLKQQTTAGYQGNAGTNGFGLYDATQTYLNTQGATLKYWAGFDQGSTYWVEEVPNTPYYDDFTAAVAPYAEALNNGKTGYFYLANSGTAFTDFIQAYNQAAENASNNVDMTATEYADALAKFQAAIVLPEDGYYRISNKNMGTGSYGYMGVNASSKLVGNITAEIAAADAGTIFYVKNNGGYYSFKAQGVYGAAASQSTAVAADATEHNFILAAAAPGYGYIQTQSGVARSCYHAAASQSYNVVGWEAGADASQWVFEPAKRLTINMNAVGSESYATAYLPFGVTVNGANVMRVQANVAAGKAFYFETGTDIPAETAVMLYSADGAASVEATINDEAAGFSDQNDLVGHYLAGNVADALVLGANGGVVGFYTLSATGTLGANRAYIDNSSSSDVRALVLAAGEATGISTVATEAAQNGKAYDLAGRRVQNVQNGLYIINGKKVLVK